MKTLRSLPVLLLLAALGCGSFGYRPDAPLPKGLAKGAILYSEPLATAAGVEHWRMEGPGSVEFKDGWMEMASPEEKGHHVFWCPADFSEDFVAEWDAQNLKDGLGLCIVFFAARGLDGESIFAPSQPRRTGVFSQYTSGTLNCYHISYYANAADAPDRGHANLRKNPGFNLVQSGDIGIPTASKAIHHLRLIKDGGHIVMSVDGRPCIDWTDDGKTHGPVLSGGKIGLRQMQWSRFRYRDFRVWALAKAP